MEIRNNYLDVKNLPNFKCPRCNYGKLLMLEETIVKKYPAWVLHTEEDFLDDEVGVENVISFFLTCNIKSCSEIVVTSGKLKCVREYAYYDENGGQDERIVDYYYPSSFYPTVNLFEIPDRTPQTVKEELVNSFALFWISPSSSVGSLRVALERLMDEFNISKKPRLHDRIENFGRIDNLKYTELSKLLLATKWIGNDGSHESGLHIMDAVLAFDFFEYCLYSLFESNQDLQKLAERIITIKQPLLKNFK